VINNGLCVMLLADNTYNANNKWSKNVLFNGPFRVHLFSIFAAGK
jgi:hypothetical protein